MHKMTECYVSMSERDESSLVLVTSSHGVIAYVVHFSRKLEWRFDLRRIRRRIFGNVSSDGTVEQMVRRLTRLHEFR